MRLGLGLDLGLDFLADFNINFSGVFSADFSSASSVKSTVSVFKGWLLDFSFDFSVGLELSLGAAFGLNFGEVELSFGFDSEASFTTELGGIEFMLLESLLMRSSLVLCLEGLFSAFLDGDVEGLLVVPLVNGVVCDLGCGFSLLELLDSLELLRCL
jgi:hypothetical protein